MFEYEIDKNNKNEGRILKGNYIVGKIYATKDGLMIVGDNKNLKKRTKRSKV